MCGIRCTLYERCLDIEIWEPGPEIPDDEKLWEPGPEIPVMILSCDDIELWESDPEISVLVMSI